MQLEALAKILRENGIVGAGGAGFPAYAKLDARADTIILNCAECEPLFKVHRQMLEQFAYEIVCAFSTVADAVGAERAIIGLKPSYKGAADAVMAVSEAFPKVSISYLPEIYPAGDEVILTYETTGRSIKAGNLPISVGVTVFNVETMLNIYRALNEKAAVTHKYVMVAGEVAEPKILKAPIGISFKELVDLCGGSLIKDPSYLIGGPMTGTIGTAHGFVTKTTNAVILLPQDHYIVQRKTVKANIGIKRAMSACCSCRMCTDLCPRNLMGHPIDPQGFMHSISQNKVLDSTPFLNTFSCSQCGLCEMYSCMQGLSPATLIGEYRAGLRAKGITPPKEPAYSGVSDKRDYRTVPVSRLVRRLGLSKYNIEIPFKEMDIKSKRLRILLSQNIGAPSEAIVKKGEMVEQGQMIAAAPEGKLGVAIHSPMAGKIAEVTSKFIMIEKGRN
ncbi:MAG: SLBB domain-containing protein [Clostridia bacterium]|nr:SLBB domain-containing protein [Clostridia bacterium]